MNSLLEQISHQIDVALIPVTSSNITAVGYGPKLQNLWVMFQNKMLYRYDDIPYDSFVALLTAESKGKWLNANLRNDKVKFARFKIE